MAGSLETPPGPLWALQGRQATANNDQQRRSEPRSVRLSTSLTRGKKRAPQTQGKKK